MSSARPLPILGVPGRSALADCVHQGALLAFDFDGTLAPLADHPDQVRLPASTRDYLEQLMLHCPVAVISGRSICDVQGYLPDLTHVLGNHGGEGDGVAPGIRIRAHGIVRDWIAQLDRLLTTLPGVMIEDKGASLALHYRASSDHAATGRILDHLTKDLAPRPRPLHGHAVLNLIPPGLPDKGVALRALMERYGYRHALFIGDDISDDLVFRRHDPDVLGIQIGATAPFSASWYLDHQRDIDPFLHLLLRFAIENVSCPASS